ncbi:hypothetical protein [Mesorhizobium sp.]|jgi:hypothetical protein|nr:hypothetical protein [Mesorhizobium sp.]
MAIAIEYLLYLRSKCRLDQEWIQIRRVAATAAGEGGATSGVEKIAFPD